MNKLHVQGLFSIDQVNHNTKMVPNIHTSEHGLKLADAGKLGLGQKQKVIKMCDTYT